MRKGGFRRGFEASADTITTMYGRLAAGLGGLLVGFHAWLFASQAWSGRFTEPGLVLRWLAAAGLVAVLVALRQRQVSLARRATVAIWLLAALLHGPAVATRAGFEVPALPESVVSTVQAAAVSLVAGVGLAIVLLARRLALVARATWLRVARHGAALTRSIRALAIAPRPPPAVSSLA
jgi:hypothetical protein